MHAPMVVTWSEFETFNLPYQYMADSLCIVNWGAYKEDKPAQVTYRREARPEAPVEDWSIVLDLSHGIKLEDSDAGFYSDDNLTTSEVIRRIEASQALASDLTWDLGI